MRGLRFVPLATVLSLLLATVAPTLVLAQARPAQAFAPATVDRGAAIGRALDYLRSKQLASGAFEGFTPGQADDFTTTKAVLAVAAAGRPQSFLARDALAYLAGRASAYTHQTGTALLFPGRAGQLAVAVVAAGGEPSTFGGVNLVAELEATYDAATGAYQSPAREGFSSGEASTINQLWAILGLAAAQRAVPAKASDYLLGKQETDGSGGWGFGFGGDVDTTGLVLQALIASGNVPPDHSKIAMGVAYLRAAQATTGGWESFGSLSADSTASAIQAAAAVGYVPATVSWLTASGRTPVDDLAALQAADGSLGGNALGTAHAIAGLAEAPLPLYGPRQRVRQALTWLASQQNADGSYNGFSGPSPGATSDAVLAFAAGRVDPSTVMKAASSPLDYLASQASAFASVGPDAVGKLIVAVAASGRDPRAFGGISLVQSLNGRYHPAHAGYGDAGNTWHQSFALLGLAAAGEPIPAAAITNLLSLQQSDGGWKYDLSAGEFNTTGVDNTGLALMALNAAGNSSGNARAVAFLRSQQDATGGWGNANSTALALQGLTAAGIVSTTEALQRYQKRDGSFYYDPTFKADNALATTQAVPALLGVVFPVRSTAALSPHAVVPVASDPDRYSLAK